MSTKRFILIGAGFWARFQLAGWREVGGVECVGIYNRTRSKAEALAREFGIDRASDNAEELIDTLKPDFIDIVTDVDTHPKFVSLAASRGIAAICQKPMAPTLEQADSMVEECRRAGVPLFINENWRWQTPIRALQEELARESIGVVFRARIDMVSGFPVFANQPFLRDVENFILMDVGSHVLDVARFLFGDAARAYCQTHRVHSGIRGEDVATVMLQMQSGATVVCNMGYAENHLEHDRFPETYIFVEGSKGSIELGPDFWLRVTTSTGTHSRRCPPPRYNWANPAYDLVHASIVDCHRNLLAGLTGGSAETTGHDNLKTARLVFGAYQSASTGSAIKIP